MGELKDRIREARTASGFTQAEMAEKIGLTKNFVSLIENGQRSPSDRTLSDISRACDVNLAWLKTGAGEMRRPVGKEEELSEIFADLEVEETTKARFIRALAGMPDDFFEPALKLAIKFLERFTEEEQEPPGE